MDGLRALQEKHPLIGDVRGKGLMIGIELVRDRQTKERAVEERNALVQAMFRRGVLILGAGQERDPPRAAARVLEATRPTACWTCSTRRWRKSPESRSLARRARLTGTLKREPHRRTRPAASNRVT